MFTCWAIAAQTASPDCASLQLTEYQFALDQHPHTELWFVTPGIAWHRAQPLLRWKTRDGRVWPATISGELNNTDNRFNWWRVDLAPGAYRLIVDLWRADTRAEKIAVSLHWFSTDGLPLQKLGQVQTYDSARRGVFHFDCKGREQLLIRIARNAGHLEYRMGIFGWGEAVEIPFFGHARPLPVVLRVGETKTALLSPVDEANSEAYYRVDLCPGKYLVTAKFQRQDKTPGAVSGSVAILGPDGDFRSNLIEVNRGGAFAEDRVSFLESNHETLLLRLRIRAGIQEVSLTINRFATPI